MKRTPVTHFMRSDPPVASPEMSLTDFVAERGVPFSMEKVPTLLGRVIAKDEIDRPAHSRGVKVREIMTRDVVSVTVNDTLEDVAWLMLRKKVSLIPVVSDGVLAGEVRRIDVLRLIYAAD